MKKTEWYPKSISPKRVGVYEVKDQTGILAGGTWYSYFDGKKFCYRHCVSASLAFACRDNYTGASEKSVWRGLTRNPE